MEIIKALVWVIYTLLRLLTYKTSEMDQGVYWYGMEMNWEAIAGFSSCLISILAAVLVIRSERKSAKEALEHAKVIADKALAQAINDAKESQKLTLQALKDAKETAKNSLKPLLTEFRLHDLTIQKNITIEVRNNGVGPAIYKSIKWYYSNGNILEFNDDDHLIDFLDKKFKEMLPSYRDIADFQIMSYDPNDAIKVGDSIEFLSIKENHNNKKVGFNKLWDDMHEEVEKLSIELNYESIYGDKETLISYTKKTNDTAK